MRWTRSFQLLEHQDIAITKPAFPPSNGVLLEAWENKCSSGITSCNTSDSQCGCLYQCRIRREIQWQALGCCFVQWCSFGPSLVGIDAIFSAVGSEMQPVAVGSRRQESRRQGSRRQGSRRQGSRRQELLASVFARGGPAVKLNGKIYLRTLQCAAGALYRPGAQSAEVFGPDLDGGSNALRTACSRRTAGFISHLVMSRRRLASTPKHKPQRCSDQSRAVCKITLLAACSRRTARCTSHLAMRRRCFASTPSTNRRDAWAKAGW